MTDLSASVRRLTDALMKEKLREAEAEVLRKHSGSAQQAEYEPMIRQTARDACEWTVATIAGSLQSDIDLRTALIEAFRGQDARVAPFAADLTDTAIAVVYSWIAEATITDSERATH